MFEGLFASTLFKPLKEETHNKIVFLEKEVELVKKLDSNHPVVVSDSGEFSLWLRAAQLGDVVSTTMGMHFNAGLDLISLQTSKGVEVTMLVSLVS